MGIYISEKQDFCSFAAPETASFSIVSIKLLLIVHKIAVSGP